MAKQEITLAPSESKLVSFEATPHEAKTYHVSVNGLTGSFRAIAAPKAVEITKIALDKDELIGGEKFNITITFSNPNDYDVWLRPKFAFGHLDAEFVPEVALYGWEYYYEPHGYSPGCSFDWVDLGYVQHMGSGMTNYVYDPEGCALVTGEYAYLKVPARSTATTKREWYACAVDYGVRDVCVRVEDAFAVIYHPGGIGICHYGLPEAVGKTRHYERVDVEPFEATVSDIVTIGIPPEAVTIDSLEVQLLNGKANTQVTITNNTGKTLISNPGDSIYTRLSIDGYAAEQIELYPEKTYHMQVWTGIKWVWTDRTEPAKIVEAGEKLCTLLTQKSAGSGSTIGSIPPGTTVKSFSFDLMGGWYGPQFTYYDPPSHTNQIIPWSHLKEVLEGKSGYAHTHFWQVDESGLEYIYGADVEKTFEGIFSSERRTWEETEWEPPPPPEYPGWGGWGGWSF